MPEPTEYPFQSVKVSGEGYLLDGVTFASEGSNVWGYIQQWIAEGNPVEPEFTPEEQSARDRTEAEAQIIADFNAAMDQIASHYPAHERETWGQQLSEARAFTDDADADTPMLDAMSGGDVAIKSHLATRIIANAQAFSAFSGNALRAKREALAALEGD